MYVKEEEFLNLKNPNFLVSKSNSGPAARSRAGNPSVRPVGPAASPAAARARLGLWLRGGGGGGAARSGGDAWCPARGAHPGRPPHLGPPPRPQGPGEPAAPSPPGGSLPTRMRLKETLARPPPAPPQCARRVPRCARRLHKWARPLPPSRAWAPGSGSGRGHAVCTGHPSLYAALSGVGSCLVSVTLPLSFRPPGPGRS